MIKILHIIACKTIMVLIKAIVSASLLSPIFSPRAFAHNFQNFFIALAARLEPATYGLEVRCSIQLSYASVKGANSTNVNTGLLTDKPFLIPASKRYSEPKTQGGSLTASRLISVMTSPVKPVIVITQSYVQLLLFTNPK